MSYKRGVMIFAVFLSVCHNIPRVWMFTHVSGAIKRQPLCCCSSRDKRDEAERAMEQAARLRREVALMEDEMAKDVRSPEDGGMSMIKNEPNKFEDSTSLWSLASTSWLLKLDVGREEGTWMPQDWGRSGRRIRVDLTIHFLPRGNMTANVSSPFIDMNVSPGRWKTLRPSGRKPRRKINAGSTSITADTCRFWLETDGFSRGDVSIPPGNMYFAVPSWGSKLSRKGLITVRQKRRYFQVFHTFKSPICPAKPSRFPGGVKVWSMETLDLQSMTDGLSLAVPAFPIGTDTR